MHLTRLQPPHINSLNAPKYVLYTPFIHNKARSVVGKAVSNVFKGFLEVC